MSKPIKTTEDLINFYNAFTKVYGEGIYVKSDTHPCGWEYIDLTKYNYFGDYRDLDINETIDASEISGGCYSYHEFEGLTPFQLLQQVGENWCFERNAIDWV